jgi:hypothetical protein
MGDRGGKGKDEKSDQSRIRFGYSLPITSPPFRPPHSPVVQGVPRQEQKKKIYRLAETDSAAGAESHRCVVVRGQPQHGLIGTTHVLLLGGRDRGLIRMRLHVTRASAVLGLGTVSSLKHLTRPVNVNRLLFTSSAQMQTSRQWCLSQQTLAISMLNSHISMSHMPQVSCISPAEMIDSWPRQQSKSAPL